MKPEEQAFVKKIEGLEENNLLRQYFTSERLQGAYVNINCKKLISFGCNDYFGLSNHPEIIEAAIKATKKYGAGAGASRLITGNNPLYSALEKEISKVKNTEDAAVFGSGYLANIGVISSLADREDLIISDKLVHACIIDGAKLSGAKFLRFNHNEPSSLESILKKNRKKYKKCLIITETIFSMDGDVAPLKAIKKLADEYKAFLVVDDAHSIDFTKKCEKGIIYIGTFSKALGSYGGYVAASKSIIKYIKTASRSIMFSTALPPAVLAANLKALEIARDKKLTEKVLRNAEIFTDKLGLKKAESAIVPVIVKTNEKALKISLELQKVGFYVPAIRPPTVPVGTSRLRFSFSAIHKEQDIVKSALLLKALI